MKKILVPGTFDLLHYGHMRFLAACRKYGSVVVALATDRHAHPKRKPIMNYAERKETLFHTPYVYDVIPKDEHSLWPAINEVKPYMVAYGSDWSKAEWMRMNGIADDLMYGGGVIIQEIPNPMVVSTTMLIARASQYMRGSQLH